MNWDSVQQLVRKVVDFGVGIVVANGFLNDEMGTVAAGGVVALINVGWWFYWNRIRPQPQPQP